MVNCVRKVHSDVNLCRDTGPCIYESGLGDHRRKRFGNWARQAFVAGLNLWIDGRRQQEARLSIMEDMRGVGDFLKLTACQPGQVLGAGDVRADPAVRSQNNEPVDRYANFFLMHPSDGEMNPFPRPVLLVVLVRAQASLAGQLCSETSSLLLSVFSR